MFFLLFFMAIQPGTVGIVWAQNAPAASEEASVKKTVAVQDLERELIPLEDIMQVAEKNSPFLKYEEAQIKGRQENVTLTRRDFHRNLSAFGNYSTGNQRFIIEGAGMSDGLRNNLLDGYRVGLNLNIPLSDFTTRRQKVNVGLAELEAARHQRDQAIMELRRQVAQEYNALLTAQRIMRITSQNMESAKVMQEMAERQFQDGQITIEEYARVTEIAVNAEVTYETVKRDFTTLYMQFEDLVGVSMTSLMKRR
ncbi:MAG: TolC family protein [Cytophagaceae bacterium]